MKHVGKTLKMCQQITTLKCFQWKFPHVTQTHSQIHARTNNKQVWHLKLCENSKYVSFFLFLLMKLIARLIANI